MAKPTGGLLAFDARGSIGKTIVYSTWRGRNYVRRHVFPANPQSPGQDLTRNTFSWLQQVWKEGPTLFQAPWALYAKGQVMTDRNAFGKFNIAALRSETDLANFVFSPGAKGGPACSSITVVGAAGQITIEAVVPTPPTDWTLTEVDFGLILDQDPQTDIDYTIQTTFDASPTPFQAVFTGLANGTWWGAAWPKWLKPDGISVAYGPAIKLSDTVP